MVFTEYAVEIELIEALLGTVPKNPKVYAEYIASKAPSPDLAEEEVSLENQRETIEKSGWTGFHEDSEGLFLYNYQVLGFLKEAGQTLKEQLGIKNLRSKIDNFVYVNPRRIRLAKEPSGVLERPIRCMTMQGPRVALTRSDYVPEGTRLAFSLVLLDNKEIKVETLTELLRFGQLKGLGQFRNGSYGRFEVVGFEGIAPKEIAKKKKA
jgi:hypothetical protein